MLGRVRLQLTAWYVAVLLAIVCIVAGTAYFVLSHALNTEVDDSLRSSANNIVAQLEERARHSPPRAISPVSGGDGAHEDDPNEGLEYFSQSGNDVFYLILSPDGTVLLNPLNVGTGTLVDGTAVEQALQDGEAWRTLSGDDGQTRVLFTTAQGTQGAINVVEVGRSLSRHSAQLNNLLTVLLATGAAGLALAAVGGFWLAGRALQPTRDAMQRQRQFVSDASHELRTPLTLIRASADAIQGGSANRLDDPDRASLNDILAESDRMSGLVDELLTLARLEEGHPDVVRESVDGAIIVAAAAREAELLTQGKTVSIHLDAPEPLTLRCDSTRIGQVLRILLDNAIRHTPAGGSITAGVRRTGDDAEFWVQDTGPGIAPEHLERIFQRFYRVDEPRTRGAGGSGLGLSIARHIVEAHGGRIEAQSGKDVSGARFVFHLPIQ